MKKDQMQVARTSWCLPTIVGGHYELESEHSMNMHQLEGKLTSPQNIISNLGTHSLPTKCHRSHEGYHSVAHTQGQA